MISMLHHRGPDDYGYYKDSNVGLAHARLSIIDLAGGHQPMADNDDTTMLIFNGEIYNFPELRRELERRGYTFRTNSDTEVILNGYREWGEDVVQHLNGMFGFAIWDKIRKKLLIARDRMGIKLVYYRIDGGTVTFGSEIKPLLAVSTEKPEIDPTALNLFLRYRYTPSPLTIFKGVKKLADFSAFPHQFPDSSTIWLFKERLKDTGCHDLVWKEFQSQLDAKGLMMCVL